MFIGLDLGTTNIKALLVDSAGLVVARSSAPVSIRHAADGAVEQDIEEIWSATLAALGGVGSAQQRAAVRAVGISAQGGALQIIAGDGRPVGAVISWLDGRGGPYNEALNADPGREWLIRHTGHARSNLSLGQLMRLGEQSPELLAPPNRIGFVGDVIVARLCGRAAHDATSLSIAWLFSPQEGGTSAELLARVGAAADQLPDLLGLREPAGGLLPSVAEETSLPAGVPVSPAVHDQYAAALGSGSIHLGDVMLGAGTAWVLLAATDRLMPPVIDAGFVCTHVVEGLFGQMLSMVNGGSAFAWAAELVGLADKSGGELDELMHGAPPGADGLLFRPTLTAGGGEGLPAGANGCLAGITLSHKPAHVLRAAAEGLACELTRYLGFLTAGGVELKRLIMTGGAAGSSVTPQIVSDMTALPLVCSTESEMSAFGAAMIARGLIETDADLADLAERVVPPSRAVMPGKDAPLYQQLFEKYLAALPTGAWRGTA